MDAPTVGRYLEHLRRAGTTARYVGNVGFYLAAWAEGLAGLARNFQSRLSRIP